MGIEHRSAAYFLVREQRSGDLRPKGAILYKSFKLRVT